MCDSKLCTKKEVAEKLNCSESTVDRLRKDGLINDVRIPRIGVRFRKRDVETLIKRSISFNDDIPDVLTQEKSGTCLNLDTFDRKYLKKSNKGESSVRKKRLSWDYGRKGVFLRETKKGGTWFIWFYRKENNGSWKRIKERVPEAQNRGEAVAAMLKAFDAERRKQVIGRAGKKTSTFKEFSEVYLEKYAKVAKRSWESDEFYLNSHLIPFFGDSELSDMNSEQVCEFIASKIDLGIKRNSINRYIQVLRKMMNMAIDWGYGVEKNPVQRSHLFKEEEFCRDVIWTQEEYERLLNVAPPHLRSILVCVWNTGMRKSEILTLKWKDLSLNGEKVHLVIRAENSKNGKARNIPVNETLLNELRKLKARNNGLCEHVFVYYDCSLKTYRTVKDFRNAFSNACKKTGISGKRFHDFRHTFASRALENGASPVAVKNVLGHSRLRTTETYLHASWESMKKAVESISGSQDKGDSSSKELSRFCPAKDGSVDKFPLTSLISMN